MSILFSAWIVLRKSLKIDKFVHLFSDYGCGTYGFGIIIVYTYRIVAIGLGINDNQICCRSCTEELSDEGTMLVGD